MSVRLSDRAISDMIAIYLEGASLFGQGQAERYQDGLDEAFQLIAQYPLSARDRPEFTPPVRAHTHGAHVILYSVASRDVEILRIRHRAEDWAAQDPSA